MINEAPIGLGWSSCSGRTNGVIGFGTAAVDVVGIDGELRILLLLLLPMLSTELADGISDGKPSDDSPVGIDEGSVN